ncbi:ATP-grasp domain-containing protein [Nocardioides bruguierae]|uniref:ATP-grasp domain-containing protein n=1 Tax=Nocardioides bruguierae TaxID=2945102 RepID=A0A9X2IIB1_9ACTN|nr:ATP-grasp domain-containing protein [Nocardioides bruguierae]MCM0622630.1 ATP-grasp domain-containing protein [Nocardioides bruguierae]
MVVGDGSVTARDLFLGLQWCEDLTFVLEPCRTSSAVRTLFGDQARYVELTDIAGISADAVITFSEHLLDVAAAQSARIGLADDAVDVALGVRDKGVQRNRLAAGGLEHVRTAVIGGLDDVARAAGEVGFPLVLKPVAGQGSRHTRMIASASDLETACVSYFATDAGLRLEPLIAETYLCGRPSAPFGDYVSVESVVFEGEPIHLGVTGKLPYLTPFRETCQFFPSGLPEAEVAEILELAGSAIKSLRIRAGATHIEMKLTEQGPRIIEVNGRLGGYINELYSRVLGCDLIELVSKAACGERPELSEPAVDRVRFQYFHQPPRNASQVVGMCGGRDVARDPAVSSYQRLVALPADLPQDDRSFDLDLLCGEASTHDDFLATLGRLRAMLEFQFAIAARPSTSETLLRITGDRLD